MLRWDFSAHGSYPPPGRFAAKPARKDRLRDRKYLKKNDNFPALRMISGRGRIANQAHR
jgi:hypothetical protein